MLRTAVTSALVGALFVLATSNLAAQMDRDPAPSRQAMERLAFLVGEWEGDGWLATRDGRLEIRQSESVRYELGGTILVIEGTARARQGASVGDVIFNAYAVVSWSEADGYTMRSYLWNGLEGSRTIEVGDASFAWNQQTPGGPVRYEMQLTASGEWHEVGRMTRNGHVIEIIDFKLTRR